jgi:hypothetical protein
MTPAATHDKISVIVPFLPAVRFHPVVLMPFM